MTPPRWGLAITLAVLVALPVLSGHTGAAAVAAPRDPGRAPLALASGADSAPRTPAGSLLPVAPGWAQNISLAPGLLPHPSAAPPAISGISAVPPIQIPSTSPYVFHFLANSTTCCVSANFTAPTGTWALILLNYTGQAVNGVYDSSYRAYVDQAQVFFGTTPEYGIWFVEKDITEYTSLFHGTFNFTFLLSAAVTTGYFETSVSLYFYPVPTGARPPVEPTEVVPIWHRVFVSTSTLSVTSTVTVPSNATNATLELWTYGFNPDEFWYAEQPDFRALTVAVDGRFLAAQTPFPFINTGGSDLFAWRPITGLYTLNDPAYEVDVSGALGFLEGTHTFAANLTGVTSGSDWLIGGSLLLYTNDSVGSASLDSYQFTITPASTTTDHTTYYDVAAGYAWAYTSAVILATGAETATDFANVSFATQMALSTDWANLTMLESASIHTVVTSASGSTDLVALTSFPVVMHLGSVFIPFSGSGTSYPIYGNVTTYFLDLHQEWDQTTTWTVATGSTSTVVRQSIDGRDEGGNNVFQAEEELTGPNAALLLGILFIESETSQEYQASSSPGGPTWSYDHLLMGESYNPPGPNNAETVFVDRTVSPVNVVVASAPGVAEVGASALLSAEVAGGTAPYAYAYSGLPSGCVGANAPAVSCAPTVSGSFLVVATVTDARGTVGTGVLELTVVPAPTLNVSTGPTVPDAGGVIFLNATPSGGFGPYVCHWSVGGAASQNQSCGTSFQVPAPDPANYTVRVYATDAVGGRSATSTTVVDVAAVPAVSLSPTATQKVVVGGAVAFTAMLFGGGAAPTYLWYVNGTVAQNGSTDTFVFVPAGAASFLISVQVRDAAGSETSAGPVTVVATAPPPPSSNGTASSVPASTPWYLYLGVGLVIGAVAASGAGLALGMRRRPPGE